MKTIAVLTYLLLLTSICRPAQALEAAPPATPSNRDNTGPTRNADTGTTNHSRDLKNNQFHERGRDKHNRADEIFRQNTVVPDSPHAPSPGR